MDSCTTPDRYMKFSTDAYGLLRMGPDDFGAPLTFLSAPL